MPISDDLVRVDADRGKARFVARHLAVPDYGDFANSNAPPSTPVPPTPSHVSFDIRWDRGGKRTTIRDDTFDFAGTFFDDAGIDGSITIDFTARHDGGTVAYRSDRGPQHVVAGGVGRGRNGIFYP